MKGSIKATLKGSRRVLVFKLLRGVVSGLGFIAGRMIDDWDVAAANEAAVYVACSCLSSEEFCLGFFRGLGLGIRGFGSVTSG